ncbi:hypothetical protein GCM10009603_33900 [Nocardiopsis exhalans]
MEKLDRECEASGRLLAAWRAQNSRTGWPEWARDLASIETAARHVTLVTSAGVPGMLQAPEYATEVFRAGSPMASAEDLASLVTLRCERLSALPELRVTAVFPATAVGGLSPSLQSAQAKHLLAWAETGRVTVCLAPLGTSMIVPVAPLMNYRLRSGERIIASDHADGTVLLTADATERVDAVVTAALTTALPVASSLEYLESLT